MPGPNFYRDDHTPADFLFSFIEHHSDPKTRHISKYEKERLSKIAVKLQHQETSHE